MPDLPLSLKNSLPLVKEKIRAPRQQKSESKEKDELLSMHSPTLSKSDREEKSIHSPLPSPKLRPARNFFISASIVFRETEEAEEDGSGTVASVSWSDP